MLQVQSIKLDKDFITLNFGFSQETIHFNNLQISQLPHQFKYFGAKKKLIFELINDNRKIIIYDYWSDYKSIINSLFEANLLDKELEKKKEKTQKNITKIIVISTLFLTITIIVFVLVQMFVLEVSQEALTFSILIFSVLVTTIFVIIARNHPKFKDYRNTMSGKNKQ